MKHPHKDRTDHKEKLPADYAERVQAAVDAGEREKVAEIQRPRSSWTAVTALTGARNAVAAVASEIPGARRLSIEGQDHGVASAVIAPVLIAFLR